MRPERSSANGLQRQRVAQEAARIMAEEGVRDFQSAKRRAAQRLSLPETRHWPSNLEIEQALTDYMRLFQGRDLAARLVRLRGTALEAMRFLARFEPRLVGAVLSGTATGESPVELHLTAESPEAVGLWLDEHAIPCEQYDHRLRYGANRHEVLPAYRFTADGVTIELTIMTREQAREAPLSPVDGRPMRRASLRELELLLSPEDRG